MFKFVNRKPNQYLRIFMKNFVLYFCVTFFLIIFSLKEAVSQDRIVFLDGESIDCKILGYSDSLTSSERVIRRKPREETHLNEEIFALYFGDTSEVVIYKPNPERNMTFTVEQMRQYVAGAAYAHENYTAFLLTTGAFVSGVGGGMLGFYGLLLPAAYNITAGAVRPFPKQSKNEDLPLLDNEFFILGYQNVAQRKKVRQMLLSSVVGLVAVYTYTFILFLGD